jgi:hypothetical protein
MNAQANSSKWQRRFPPFYARVSRWAQFHKENAGKCTAEQAATALQNALLRR